MTWQRIEGEGEPTDRPWDTRPVAVLVPEPDTDSAVREIAAPEPSTAPVDDLEPFVPVPDEPIVDFARDVLGFTLRPRQASIVSEIYRDGIETAVLRLGRRSGKGRIAATIATYEATVHADAHTAHVPPGEQVAIVVVATSQRQARTVHRYIRKFLQAPGLVHLIAREAEDEIELTNGIVILTLPCSAAGARGSAVAVVILDEAAWFTGRDGSPLDVAELWRALVPATAQFPARRVLVLSTPRWTVGWFADLCRTAAGEADPTTRHWHASTAEVNPGISASFLDSERAKDPVAFRREYEAVLESGIGAVFDADTVRAAIADRGMLPPRQHPPTSYLCAIDPAYTGDRFALVVGHYDPGRRLIVDRIAGWQGSKSRPLDHRTVLDEVAAIALAYRARVLLDQYAAEPIAQGLGERGVGALRKPWRNELKVDAVTALRQLLYQGRLELPSHPELVSELVSLEQRPLPSGRPRIAAPPGGHDDYASALLALAHELERGATSSGEFSLIA